MSIPVTVFFTVVCRILRLGDKVIIVSTLDGTYIFLGNTSKVDIAGAYSVVWSVIQWASHGCRKSNRSKCQMFVIYSGIVSFWVFCLCKSNLQI